MKFVALVGVVVLAVLLFIQDRGGSDAVQGAMTGIGFVIVVPIFLVAAFLVWLFRQ